MVRWTVYVTTFILLNLNYIESSVKRQSVVCLKELHAFAVSKTTLNASSDTTRICSTAFGCCNKSIENEMKSQVETKLKILIDTENEGVKSKFKTIYDDLKALSENVLQQTSESSINFIQKSPKNLAQMAPQVAPLIRALFKDLQSYLTNNDLKIKNSTTKFFKNFFVVVYQNLILQSSQKRLPSSYSKCLMDKMHLMKPFLNVPREITAMLQKDLLPVQVFLHALQTADHLLEVSKNVELSEKCGDTLVKMSYCSLCDGLKDLKPCFGYCSDVLAQCLDPYTQIQHYWNLFITKMNDLSNNILLSKSLYASELFKELRQKISNALSNAMQLPSKKVFSYCGNMTHSNINKIVSFKKKQKDVPASSDFGTQTNGDLYLTSDSRNSGSYQKVPSDSDIRKIMSVVMRNLTDTRNYFGNLHSVLCTSVLAAPMNEQNKCWNGTDGLGRYNTSYNLVKNATSLKPTNSEILTKGVLQLLQRINNDIKRAEEIENESSSSGDFDVSGSGSGEGSSPDDVDGGTYIPSGSGDDEECEDDEDCDGYSGSGVKVPGNKSTGSENSSGTVTTQPPVLASKNSGKRWYPCSLTLLGLLFCYLIFVR